MIYIDNPNTKIGPLSSIFLAGLDSGNNGWIGFAIEVSNQVAKGEWDSPQGVAYLNRYWTMHVRGYGWTR